ncbi:MAG TPA: DUF1501 domain-containing protein [Pirellulales bacterium]|nr:DUF1501 domain-containing protein [Pirellulales bacterium]
MRPVGSISRRLFLEAGTLALFGGARRAAPVLAGNSAAGGRAKSCILVYLLGGPPHIDMWDLKPDAPAEIRGPFQPIATNVPGIRFGEHLPLLARQADKLAVLRSLTYPNNDHPFMTYHTLTGRVSAVPLDANTVLPPSRNDHPHMGAVVAKFKHTSTDVPGYVAIPEVRLRMQPLPVAGGGRAGMLGPRYDPFAINDDPSQPLPALQLPHDVSAERFARRQSLLAVVDGHSPKARPPDEYQTLRGSASRLLGSSTTQETFSLDKEPEALRDRYGMHRFGQSLLLARRLVENGVSFVAVHFNYMSLCDGWDTHAKNFPCLKDELLPLLDQGLSAMLDDLAGRGLLDETLVVTMGEFGRTPKVNDQGGRDHWGSCASVVFAGGGTRGGTVVGASDKIGAYPTDRAVGPPDVVATIYHALGLKPESLMYDALLGRPMTLAEGRPIDPLF